MPFNDPASEGATECANPVCWHWADFPSRYCTECDQMLSDMAQELIDDALEHDQLSDLDADCA